MAIVIWSKRAHKAKDKLYFNGILEFGVTVAFKIIYWYDEQNDKVVIEDIWDTRRSPENLTKRLNIEH